MPKGKKTRAPDRRELTPIFCDKVQAAEGRVIYWDKKQPGLGLCVQPSGAKSWKVPYRHRGRLRWFTIDRYPRIGLKKAREIAEEVLARASLGHDPLGDRVAARRGDTFRQVAARWLKQAEEEGRYRSLGQSKRYLEHDLLPELGGLKARDVATVDVKRAFDKVAKRGSPIAANGALAVASTIYRWAVDEGVPGVGANPCLGIKRKPVKSRDRVLTETEIGRVWRAFDAAGAAQGAALRLCLLTGQRVGEVRGLKFSEIDSGWWTIPNERTKNKKTHRVWLSSAAAAIVDAQRDGDTDHVFRRKGNDEPIGEISARRVSEAAAVEDYKNHDLRRTAASLMTGMGIHRLTVSKILNHSEAGITQVYDRHSYDPEKRHALDSWAAELDRIVSGRIAEDNVVEIGGAP